MLSKMWMAPVEFLRWSQTPHEDGILNDTGAPAAGYYQGAGAFVENDDANVLGGVDGDRTATICRAYDQDAFIVEILDGS